MSAADGFENSLLLLLFNNTTIANMGDAGGIPGSTGAGSTQLALSTNYGDASADLTTNEIAYTTYARPTQARSGAGWTVAGSSASNAALIQFGNMTAGGPDTAHSVGLGFISSGDIIRLWATLTADLVINNGVNPQFAIGACAWSVD